MHLYFLPVIFLSFASASAYAQEATEPPAPLTAFEQMLAYVHVHDPQLNAKREELRILDEKLSQANAGFRPSLHAYGAYGRQRIGIDGQDPQYGKERTHSLQAVQPVFSGFGTVAERDAAMARVEAGRAELAAQEQTTLINAISAWLELCEKETMLALNEANLQRMHRYHQAARERHEAGDGTLTDTALAETRLADAQAKYAQAEAALEAARAAYERNTGLMAPRVNFPALPSGLPASKADTLEQARRNPALLQAYYLQQAAMHDIDKASSALWPDVSLRASMADERTTSFGADRLRDDSLTLNIHIPLYQGGAEYSRIREAKIRREKSAQDAMDTARIVTAIAQQSWGNFVAALKVSEAASVAAQAAARALAGIEEEQIQGTRTLTEVLDAQNELYVSQLNETGAQRSLREEAFRLLASTGRLTLGELRVPAELYDPLPYHEDNKGRWVGTEVQPLAHYHRH